MKQFLTTLLVIALVIIGIIIFVDNGEQNLPDENNQNGTTTEQTEIPSSWETYRSDQFDFRIAHSPETTARIEAGNHVKFTYLGPQNATGEITDGFTFTVSIYDKSAAQTLRDFAEKRLQSNLQVGELVEDISETTFNGQRAYEFVTSNLGEVTHLVLNHVNQSRVVVLSWNVSDPNNQGYDEMVNTMLSSFGFIIDEDTEDDEADVPTVSNIELAMLDRELDGGEEPERGCDRVVMIDRRIEPTTTPLNTAMEELFSIDNTTVEGWHNFIAKTNNTLSFDRAAIEGRTAQIHLTGELSGLSGVCDNPRAAIQIEETALQFSTVSDVQIYLNGEPTDLTPNGQGS